MMRSPGSADLRNPALNERNGFGAPRAPAPSPVKNGDDLQSITVNFLRVVQRLEEVVDEETAALRSGRHADLKDFNFRKGHGMLEFSRAAGLVGARAATDPALSGRLQSLRSKLVTNQAVLKMHLEAVQEIASDLSAAIQDAESDGTYSASFGRQKPRQ